MQNLFNKLPGSSSSITYRSCSHLYVQSTSFLVIMQLLSVALHLLRLLDFLDNSPLLRNTFIMMAGDNGPMLPRSVYNFNKLVSSSTAEA
jgi:hypothetical protein